MTSRHDARPNRLADSVSPYLLQHAYNPVDWYPWGDDAFEKARAENKPIFLSVGYSACHWCHVMERESFEDPEIAGLLREHFVSIKVDREERPDVDGLYMTATQIYTGQGGWPNSLFLTPDLRPFYAGTYFPPNDRYGRPGFRTVIVALAQAWKTRRAEVEEQAKEIMTALERALVPASGSAARFDPAHVRTAIGMLDKSFDETYAGFGSAPKFPPHGGLRLLLHEYEATRDGRVAELAFRTLERMALGGIHDHVGGGFHRYSTDARWILPHFEKMLYDNAQLLRNYARADELRPTPLFGRAIDGIVRWIGDQMTSPEGGFYSALDADSEGHEGKYYVWRKDELERILGPDDGRVFCELYNVSANGNFAEEASGLRDGTNIPHLARDWEMSARAAGESGEDFSAKIEAMLERLRAERLNRVAPQLDDKIQASWNGLMIAGLAYAGRLRRDETMVARARRAAEFVLERMCRDQDELFHIYGKGKITQPGFLDDYAFLIDGLIELHAADRDGRWLKAAMALADSAIRRFHDPVGGAFYSTESGALDLLIRSKDLYDKAEPSGNSIMVQSLIRLGRIGSRADYLETADRALRACSGVIARLPTAVEELLLAGLWISERRAAEPDAPGVVRAGPVAVSLVPHRIEIERGAAVDLVLKLKIDAPWHINAHAITGSYLRPTEVSMGSDPNFTLERVDYPEGIRRAFGFSPDELLVYEGEIEIPMKVRNTKKASGPFIASFILSYQLCGEDRCERPAELHVDWPVEVA